MTINICRVKDELLKILHNYLYSTNIYFSNASWTGFNQPVYCC
jgi:hypothetical protein